MCSSVSMFVQLPNSCNCRQQLYGLSDVILPSHRIAGRDTNTRRPILQQQDYRDNRHQVHAISCKGRFTAYSMAHLHTFLSKQDEAIPLTAGVRRWSHMAQAAASQQSHTPKVAVFTTVGCPYCKKAKGMLQEEQIAYQEIDVSSNITVRQELQSVTGQKTVPQAR